jgi:hypothetical protein
MANITDPQIIKWSNDRTRTMADKLAALYYSASAFLSDYTNQAIAVKITAAGASNNVGDGAGPITLPDGTSTLGDGRPILTGTSLINFRAAVIALKTSLETAVPGVGTTIADIASTDQSQGSPR